MTLMPLPAPREEHMSEPVCVTPPRSGSPPLLQIAFCAWYVAGVRTQYENIRDAARTDPLLDMRYIEVAPHKVGGLIERVPLLGDRTRGTLRTLACTSALYWQRPPHAVWTQIDTAMFPYVHTLGRWRQTPFVISIDCTRRQIDQMPEYGVIDHSSVTAAKHWFRDQMARSVYRRAACVLPWSRWAADAIQQEYGIPDERIRITPPGVTLSHWRERVSGWAEGAGEQRRAKVLFVGGDFDRKGGSLLVDVVRQSFQDQCELHLVTRDAPAHVADPHTVVYADLVPNDPRLQELYATCDMMVLPTNADCFSLASIEAMAAGMPVITTSVGGIPEIVEHKQSGLLIPPNDGAALRDAIEYLLADPMRMESMGRCGRAIVEERFDATKNAQQVFALLRELTAR